jgi:hypothetical protein
VIQTNFMQDQIADSGIIATTITAITIDRLADAVM